ncbi:hypothetical protein GCM10009838_24640 [Catenulispora subtropica]|uniref:Uncharacterized protein n=1 Tax=Catenulispora subtropica TaxID=450798 RepID=A0ABN2RAM3_9ACTN
MTFRPPESLVVVSQIPTDSFAACAAGAPTSAIPDPASTTAPTPEIRALKRRRLPPDTRRGCGEFSNTGHPLR